MWKGIRFPVWVALGAGCVLYVIEGWMSPGPLWAIPGAVFFGLALWEIRERWVPRVRAAWRRRRVRVRRGLSQQRAFELAPHSGELAVRLMNDNPGELAHVRTVFETWKATESPQDKELVYNAFAAILEEHGRHDEAGDVWVSAGYSEVQAGSSGKRMMSAVEVARRCASEVVPGMAPADSPAAVAWLRRLTSRETFFLQPIDAATVLPEDQWLTIVHGICRDLGEPLPPLFERLFRK